MNISENSSTIATYFRITFRIQFHRSCYNLMNVALRVNLVFHLYISAWRGQNVLIKIQRGSSGRLVDLNSGRKNASFSGETRGRNFTRSTARSTTSWISRLLRMPHSISHCIVEISPYFDVLLSGILSQRGQPSTLTFRGNFSAFRSFATWPSSIFRLSVSRNRRCCACCVTGKFCIIYFAYNLY